MSLTIDVHVIQNLPPNCLNRDDNGSPKQAVFGGVIRQRVSSQSLKRAMRLSFEEGLAGERVRTDHLSIRLGERVRALLAQRDVAAGDDLDEFIVSAAKLGTDGKLPTKTDTKNEEGGVDDQDSKSVVFLFSRPQLDAIAEVIAARYGTKLDKLAGDRSFKVEFAEAMNVAPSLDLAAFGRMVAGNTTASVDAACQVAHAISTHEITNEFDFFSAVEDENHSEDNRETGAGFIGTSEFTSSTIYKYLSICVDDLRANLRADTADTAAAARQLIRSFLLSLPSGKSATFAASTHPCGVLVVLRRQGQPVSYASAFETPVLTSRGGYTAGSVKALVAHVEQDRAVFGEDGESLVLVADPEAEGLSALGTRVTLPGLLERVDSFVREA
jgi:CRISPR system Cascade subunit CasC